jgi:hypothetical protein
MNIKKGYIIPKCVELKKSPLHGLGVFATEFIPKGTELGVGHYFDFHNRKEGIVNLRTTLVPFFNFNIDSNLVLKQEKPTPKWECGFSLHNRIYTKRDIQKGEELLLKYSWYNPTKPDTENNRHYIPLPNCVSIEERDGKYVLYALEDIKVGFDFGVCHHWYKPSCCFEPNPIGGYIKEDKNPNSKLVKEGRDITLCSIKRINKGESISVDYVI